MKFLNTGTVLTALFATCVLANGQEFKVKSVGSVRHGGNTEVSVVFSKPVEQASGTATANYTFSGGVQVTGATLLTGLPAANLLDVAQNPTPFGRVYDNECVVLTVTGLAPEAAASITIQNVKDRDGNTIAPTTINFKDSGYSWVDIGVHPIPGRVIPISTNGFDIYSSGRTQWSDEDQTTFVYKEITGDFELIARAEFQDFSSRWGRAGIMAREELNAGEDGATQDTTASRYCGVHANPAKCYNDSSGGIATANNQFESHFRSTVGGETASTAGGTPQYPNAWLRVQRTGDTIITYRSDDGDNWTEMAQRTVDDPGPWNAKLYVGPSFSPEIGNINAANPDDAKNRLFLYQVRFGKIPVPRVSRFDPNPTGFRLQLTDAETSVNESTLKLTLNGTAITATVSKSGPVTTAVYSQPDPFPVGSNNNLAIEFKDSAGTTVTTQQPWIAQYVTVPADYATTTFSGTQGNATANIYQIDFVRTGPNENSIGAAEQQQARGFLDNGNPRPNVAAGPTANITTVNWEQLGGDIDGTPEDGPDNFNSVRPESAPVPNEPIPQIPGSGSDPRGGTENGQPDNNIVVEVVGYANLTKGSYRMGVNSDDGFKVSVGKGVSDVFGVVLGFYDGGRGAADTIFDFYVPATGVYPIRLLWWEGSGGANVEWFTEDLATGERRLVNASNGLRTYPNGNGRAYVKSLTPANGFAGAETRPQVKAELVNGLTSVVAGQTRLIVDGVEVATGGNSVSWTPAVPYEFNSQHTGQLIWTESTTPPTVHTNNFTFAVRAAGLADLPANCFTIEAEHFDSNGQPAPGITGSGYSGGEYDQLTATHDVDYHQNEATPDSDLYRIDESPNVPMDANATAAPDLDTARPGFEVTTNYKIGWVSNGEWYNYTRTIPAGVYTVYAAQSIDPAGNAGGTLSLVTAGVGTTTQTVQDLATVSGTPPGGWGNNGLLPAPAASGGLSVFKLPGGKVTLRYTTRAGDFDWFTLAPVASAPPQVKSATPANGAIVNLNTRFEFTIEDFGATVVQNSIKLQIDNVEVSPDVTKNGDITTVSYTPTAPLAPNTEHTYRLTFSDSSGASQAVNATFTTYPAGGTGMFVIEAEDFNHGGGQAVAAASTMPYLGGAYNGLDATFDVDYHSTETLDAASGWTPVYRSGPAIAAGTTIPLNDNLGGQLGRARGLWDVNVNYKIGWVGAGDWVNYTRTIPQGNYSIYAALSHGETNPDQLSADLGLVTAGANTPNQTVQPVGRFRAPGTGGWGTNELVPMTDANANPITVALGGEQTIRMNLTSGDFDYLVLVPGGGTDQPRFTSIVKNANGTITVEWTGGGTLQAAPTVTGPWQDVAGATSPYTLAPTSAMTFGRIRK